MCKYTFKKTLLRVTKKKEKKKEKGRSVNWASAKQALFFLYRSWRTISKNFFFFFNTTEISRAADADGVWGEHWPFQEQRLQLDHVPISVTASLLVQLLISRWSPKPPGCSTRLPGRKKKKLKSPPAPSRGTFSAHFGASAASEPPGRDAADAVRDACPPQRALFCRTQPETVRNEQPLSTFKPPSTPSPQSSVFSKLHDRWGWAHCAGGDEPLPAASLAESATLPLPSFEELLQFQSVVLTPTQSNPVIQRYQTPGWIW